MKILLLIILSILLFQVSNYSQSCLPEGIVFTEQEEIDNFQLNYPNCTEIEGDVYIGSSLIYADLTDLSSLNVITSIGGDLIFTLCFQLQSLDGLENLTNIGGSFRVIYTPLTSMVGLENLNSIGGDLGIHAVGYLQNLSGMNSLSSLGGNLTFINNPSLINLLGLENLTVLNGSLGIEYDWPAGVQSLTSLTGLNNITSVAGLLRLVNCNTLTSLSGLENLTSIGEDLTLWDNDSLSSITELENLTHIGGNLTIDNNDQLIGLSGLDNIVEGSIESLCITYNPQLSSCEVKSICDYLVSPIGFVGIFGNAQGCNSSEQILDACDGAAIPTVITKHGSLIYPNPAKNRIYLIKRDNLTIKEINLYNKYGQKIGFDMFKANTIDISEIIKGMYIIELITNESRIREKIIVQ